MIFRDGLVDGVIGWGNWDYEVYLYSLVVLVVCYMQFCCCLRSVVGRSGCGRVSWL